MVSEDRLELLGSFMLLHALEATEEFVEDAVRLKDSRLADRVLWAQVCKMGRDLAPENPLFAVRGIKHSRISLTGRRPPLERRTLADRRAVVSTWQRVEQRKARRRQHRH